jgi:hypothetical protein
MKLDPIVLTMIHSGWLGMFLGVLSGAVIGLFFHREDWMGGYGSYRRRLTRLGHISFFGLAFVNFAFAFTQHVLPLGTTWGSVAMCAFLTGAASMPACCFLSAWKKPFRHLFFIPVSGVLVGVLCELFAQ